MTMIARATLGLVLLSITLATRAQPECELQPTNYLQDADFSMESANRHSPHWRSILHATGKGYRTSIDQGVLTIEKIAPQDWLFFRQKLEVTEHPEATFVFSAEYKLDLRLGDQYLAMFPLGGGPSLIARNANTQILLQSQPEQSLAHGTTDWQTMTEVITLPPGTATLEVGFLHQADGTMQVRSPALHIADETDTPCPATVLPPPPIDPADELRRI